MKAACVELQSDMMRLPDLTSSVQSSDWSSHSDSTSNRQEGLAKHTHKKKNLSWGTIEVRFHATIPGDHPCTTDGPPLTIEWDYFQEFKGLDIDVYDGNSPHRRETELALDGVERWQILKNEGFTDSEIVSGIRAAKHYQRKRVQTLHRNKHRQADELQDAMVRSMRQSFMRKVVMETSY